MPGSDGRDCLEISEFCPVEASIYGYYPSRAANYFFAIVFGILLLVQLAQGIKWRTRSFSIAMFFGCLGECVGMPPGEQPPTGLHADTIRLCGENIAARQSI